MKKKLGALLLVCALLLGMVPMYTLTAQARASSGRSDVQTEAAVPLAAQDEEPAAPNHAPVLKENVEKVTYAQVRTGRAYLLSDLQGGKLFEDPDGDRINYGSDVYWERSNDEGKTWSPRIKFSEALHGMTTIQVTEKTAGDYVYRFYVSDGKDISTEYWELHLHVVDKGSWNVRFFVSKDYNNEMPLIKVYPCLGVDEEGHDIPDYDHPVKMLYSDFTSEVPEGTEPYDPAQGQLADNGYQMFYATLEGGTYSFRGFARSEDTGAYDIPLGGMCVDIPADSNVDGNTGGGTDIYLQCVSFYNSSSKADGSRFTAEDYHMQVDCPLLGCTATMGRPYAYNDGECYPTMVYAAGNACLYNYYCYPDIPGFIFKQTINSTFSPSNGSRRITVSISPAVELKATVPEDTDFGLYFQFNNFNTSEVEPEGQNKLWSERCEYHSNGTKTYTYLVSKSNANYTWRMSDLSGRYVTKAGWVASISEPTEFTFSFLEDDATNHQSHDFTQLGSVVKTRDEADLMVNLDPSGFEEITERTRVRAYRHWEIINNDAMNIMLEPDYHWTVLAGDAPTRTVSGGNTADNWLDVKPGYPDTILAVTYDALTVEDNATHGGRFPAVNPERVGVVVVSGDGSGTADADVDFNMAVGGTTTRSMDWDYNYDTWFYNSINKRPKLDFAVRATGDVTVESAFVTADNELNVSLSDFQPVKTNQDGRYVVDLRPLNELGNGMGGTVIIRMTDDTGTSYRLVRAAKLDIHAENASHPGEDFMPGDQVRLTFDGLYRAVNKIAGIFNPTTFYLRYSAGDQEFNGVTGQYQQMDSSSILVTIPEDFEIPEGRETAAYHFTNGYIFGSMYSAADPFAFLYGMTDTGVGTNFNAVITTFYISHLADAVVKVHPKVYYDVQLTATDGDQPVPGAQVTLTDSEGNVIQPESGSLYHIGYGDYTYSVAAEDFVCAHGSFHLSSKSVSQVGEDGLIHQTITLEKAGPGAWDGEKISEPMKEDGVYVIHDAAELAGFAKMINENKTDRSIKAVLQEDIDLAGFPWTPIGLKSGFAFAGSFDGQGHSVRHLYINRQEPNTVVHYLGLFGYTDGTSAERASIANLTVDGSVTLSFDKKNASNAYVAGVVARTSYCDLKNVTSRVDVTIHTDNDALRYAGGVTAYVYNGNLINCTNEGNVLGRRNTGGVTGYFHYSSLMDGCCNTGTVRGTDYVGGLVGQITSGRLGSQPMNTVQNSYNTGAVYGTAKTGGLAGTLDSLPAIGSVLSNCFNTGTVEEGGSLVGEVGRDTAQMDSLYCLADTTPFTKNTAAFTPKALSAEEMKSADLVQELNKSAGSDLFGLGTDHPVFVRLGGILPDAPLTGDVNGDGRVDASDANLLYGYVNGLQSVIPQLSFGDVNGDGTITAQDANLIYGFVNGRLSVFPVNAK